MLDTIREFAAERAGDYAELAALELRHARYFLRFCERARGGGAHAHRRESLERLTHERANLRLAHERLLRAGQPDEALRVAIAFADALPWDAHTQEVRCWLANGLAALGAEAPDLRARALCGDGRLAVSQGRFAEAERPLREAVKVAHAAQDAATEVVARIALGRWATLVADERADDLATEALAAARATGDAQLVAEATLALAGACERRSAWHEAGELAGEALAAFREAGDPFGAAAALAELGWYDLLHGSGERAEACLDEALELRRRHGDDRRLVEPLIDAAWLALIRGQGGEARSRFLDCFALARHVDDRFNVGEALAGLAALAGKEGRWVDCARLAGASAAVHELMGAPPWESVALLLGRETEAARAVLGGARYDAALAEGRAVPAEDVVRSAASEPEPTDPFLSGALADLESP